jgi:hypothetical protein
MAPIDGEIAEGALRQLYTDYEDKRQ